MATDKRLTIRFDNETLEKLDRIATTKKLTIPETIRELISGRSIDLDSMQEQLKRHEEIIMKLTAIIEKQTKLMDTNDEILNNAIVKNSKAIVDVRNHILRVIKVQHCQYQIDETWKQVILKKFPNIISNPNDF
jgi:hypothetical protein